MNRIYVNNAKVVYGSKKVITTKETNKELALIEYFVQESVGSWKQNLLIKVFSEDLNVEPLEVGTRIKLKGTLKINSYKNENDEFVNSTEINVNEVTDIQLWVDKKDSSKDKE